MQVQKLLVKRTSSDTAAFEIRVIRSKNGVPWAITGLTPDGKQYTLTREPCEHSMQVVGYFVEALERLDRIIVRETNR